MGFSGEDKLGRNLKLGGAYKTPFTTLSADARLMAAPDGSTSGQPPLLHPFVFAPAPAQCANRGAIDLQAATRGLHELRCR